jgi:hypothetical protein
VLLSAGCHERNGVDLSGRRTRGSVFLTIEPATGETTRRLDVASALRAAGATGPFGDLGVTDEHVVAIDAFGSLLALVKESGAVAWHFDVGAKVPLVHAPTVVGNHLYVLDLAERLRVFAV